MKISKSIKQIDAEFAKEAGITLKELWSLSIMEQTKIRRRITNKRLKTQKL
jgi:hypothetical protein